MNEIVEAIILGIIQGLTEFLPVSSSGHLELAKYALGDTSIAEESMMTTVFLHFATALATIFVFKNDILELIKQFFDKSTSEGRKYVGLIIVSMIPAAFIGFFFDELIESFFHQQLTLVGACLIFTGLLLYISEKLTTTKKRIGIVSAFIIGLSQGVAILPGISRSGSTIATSLMLGIDKKESAKFSFLMVIPLIFGKIAKDLISGDFLDHMPSPIYLILGFLAAFITGVWACRFMISIVSKSKLSWFAIYCTIVGILAITISLV